VVTCRRQVDSSTVIHDELSTSVPLPRVRFWDIQVSKIDSLTRQPLCPGSPASATVTLRRWDVFIVHPYGLLRKHLVPTGDSPPRASPFLGGQRKLASRFHVVYILMTGLLYGYKTRKEMLICQLQRTIAAKSRSSVTWYVSPWLVEHF
jgi:hypothetical protein